MKTYVNYRLTSGVVHVSQGTLRDDVLSVVHDGPIPRKGEFVYFGDGSSFQVLDVQWHILIEKPSSNHHDEYPQQEVRIYLRKGTPA